MGASERIGGDLGLVRSETLAAARRRSPADFARRRKTPCDPLVEGVLRGKGRTLRIEPREFGRNPGMEDTISAPGYLKQREAPNRGR